MTSTEYTARRGSTEEPSDPDAVAERLRDRSAAIKRRELETAMERLAARGELSAERRAVLEDLADNIEARLLSAPMDALEDARRADDPDTVTALVRLFDPDRDG